MIAPNVHFVYGSIESGLLKLCTDGAQYCKLTLVQRDPSNLLLSSPWIICYRR